MRSFHNFAQIATGWVLYTPILMRPSGPLRKISFKKFYVLQISLKFPCHMIRQGEVAYMPALFSALCKASCFVFLFIYRLCSTVLRPPSTFCCHMNWPAAVPHNHIVGTGSGASRPIRDGKERKDFFIFSSYVLCWLWKTLLLKHTIKSSHPKIFIWT